MEERIIDDEYGRGVRLKKTDKGYVDVTDEALETEAQTTDGADEYEEEFAFEFPVLETDEDDEELATLSPEEALALRKKKEEEAKARKAAYEQTCQEGERLLNEQSYQAAELKYEKALSLDDEATEASVGYWRAKTEDFKNPDVLVSEYAEAGIESLEYDLGYAAAEQIKRDYRSVFERRVQELEREETPLATSVEEKQSRRREILKERIKRSGVTLLAVGLPTLALLILTIVIGLKNFTTRENTYVVPTVVLAAIFFVAFIATVLCANKFLNDLRMNRANEKLSSTADGEKLLQIRSYKELYTELLFVAPEQTSEQTSERTSE